MAIEFRCAQCNRLLRTGDETAGRHAQCPECGAISAVPTPTVAGETPAPPSAAAGGNPFAIGQIPDVQPPSDNPYQSPMSPAYPVLRLTDAAAKQRVAGPAIALVVTAVLGLIQNLLTLVFILMMASGALGAPNQNLEDVLPSLIITAIGLPGGVLMLVGAMKMKKLESYGLAMAGAIVGMVPYFSPCCLLGLPFGIWALVVLCDGSVKAAFHSRSG